MELVDKSIAQDWLRDLEGHGTWIFHFDLFPKNEEQWEIRNRRSSKAKSARILSVHRKKGLMEIF